MEIRKTCLKRSKKEIRKNKRMKFAMIKDKIPSKQSEGIFFFD